MKIAFGEEREKGEKIRVGYIQGDAGLTVRRERANAGITDAGVSVARITDMGFTNAGVADAGFASQE